MDLADIEGYVDADILQSPLRLAWYNVQSCVPSVFESLRELLIRLCIYSLIQNFTYRFCKSNIGHIIVIALGLHLLFSQISEKWMVIINIIYFFLMTSMDGLPMGPTHRGALAIVITILYTGIWQSVLSAVYFQQIRGALMILSMKMIAFAFDEWKVPLLEKLGYAFNPATILFGPFIPFKSFRNCRLLYLANHPPFAFPTFLAVLYGVLAMFCVLYSSCFVEFIPKSPAIMGDYAAAQSYRFSHYFVCFISLSSLIFGGYTTAKRTTDIGAVEMPRSMSDVVIHWNYPMHEFLHKYIFSNLLSFGYFVSIVGTFLMSSLLHGFNFQLTAILLSLGFYSYAESLLRSRMSKWLNACVKSRPCPDECSHRNQSLSIISLVVNGFFFGLNVYHLIYLGMAFDGSAEEEGYSMSHTLSHWGRWSFSSHWIAVFTLIAAKLKVY